MVGLRNHYWLLELRNKETGKLIERRRTFTYHEDDDFIAALADASENMTGIYVRIKRK